MCESAGRLSPSTSVAWRRCPSLLYFTQSQRQYICIRRLRNCNPTVDNFVSNSQIFIHVRESICYATNNKDIKQYAKRFESKCVYYNVKVVIVVAVAVLLLLSVPSSLRLLLRHRKLRQEERHHFSYRHSYDSHVIVAWLCRSLRLISVCRQPAFCPIVKRNASFVLLHRHRHLSFIEISPMLQLLWIVWYLREDLQSSVYYHSVTIFLNLSKWGGRWVYVLLLDVWIAFSFSDTVLLWPVSESVSTPGQPFILRTNLSTPPSYSSFCLSPISARSPISSLVQRAIVLSLVRLSLYSRRRRRRFSLCLICWSACAVVQHNRFQTFTAPCRHHG